MRLTFGLALASLIVSGVPAQSTLDAQLKTAYPQIAASTSATRPMLTLQQDVLASCEPKRHVPPSNAIRDGKVSYVRHEEMPLERIMPAGTQGYAGYIQIYQDSVTMFFLVPRPASMDGVSWGGVHGCVAPLSFEFAPGLLKTADFTTVQRTVSAVIR